MAKWINEEEYKEAFEGKLNTNSRTHPPLPHKEPKRENSIQNPPHYNKHPSGIECIEATRHMNFNLGNAVKYIWRADLKNDAIEDLKKAAWYIQDEIQRRERQLK